MSMSLLTPKHSLSCQLSMKLYQSRNCTTVCVSRVYKPQQCMCRAVNCNGNLIIITFFIGEAFGITKRKQKLYCRPFKFLQTLRILNEWDLKRKHKENRNDRDMNGSIQKHKDRMARRQNELYRDGGQSIYLHMYLTNFMWFIILFMFLTQTSDYRSYISLAFFTWSYGRSLLWY
jgi:hypothetical protein